MTRLTESHVEEAALAWLAELGDAVKSGPEIAPDSAHGRCCTDRVKIG